MTKIKPIYKFNSGMGGMICHTCRTIISTGPKTEEFYCDKCKQKNHIIKIMEEDESIKLYGEQMEKEVRKNKSNLNK